MDDGERGYGRQTTIQRNLTTLAIPRDFALCESNVVLGKC